MVGLVYLGTMRVSLTNVEFKLEFIKVEYETVDSLARAHKDRCFVDVAYVVGPAVQTDRVSRSCRRTGMKGVRFLSIRTQACDLYEQLRRTG